MLILALDTALAACSVALWGEGRILAHKSEDMARGHSERLIPMVLEVMHEAGVGFAAVTQIAATVGPGSFTGVRIALAAARGLALARHVPLIGVTTLEVVAGVAQQGSDFGGRYAVVDSNRAGRREDAGGGAVGAAAETLVDHLRINVVVVNEDAHARDDQADGEDQQGLADRMQEEADQPGVLRDADSTLGRSPVRLPAGSRLVFGDLHIYLLQDSGKPGAWGSG